MKILIDNGHGISTKGKRSPAEAGFPHGGRLLEYKYCREIADLVVAQLLDKGYDAERIVPENGDIDLAERCARVNAYCDRLGSKNCILVSIHNNAAGSDGKWHNAAGWSVWIARNASNNSKLLARTLYAHAAKEGLQGNRCVPSERYWVADLKICRATKCAAVLTENLFQDNVADVDFLLSEKGRAAITRVHVEGIIEYINTIKK